MGVYLKKNYQKYQVYYVKSVKLNTWNSTINTGTKQAKENKKGYIKTEAFCCRGYMLCKFKSITTNKYELNFILIGEQIFNLLYKLSHLCLNPAFVMCFSRLLVLVREKSYKQDKRKLSKVSLSFSLWFM